MNSGVPMLDDVAVVGREGGRRMQFRLQQSRSTPVLVTTNAANLWTEREEGTIGFSLLVRFLFYSVSLPIRSASSFFWKFN